MVSLFPYLRALLLEHKSDNFGEILLHLFIADLARKATDMYVALRSKSSDDRDQLETSLRNLLAFPETSYRSNPDTIRTSPFFTALREKAFRIATKSRSQPGTAFVSHKIQQ